MSKTDFLKKDLEQKIVNSQEWELSWPTFSGKIKYSSSCGAEPNTPLSCANN